MEGAGQAEVKRSGREVEPSGRKGAFAAFSVVVLVVSAIVGLWTQQTPAAAGHGMRLPYPPGTTYRALLGHSPPSQYAIDFGIGFDQDVVAAHHGTVWSTKFDSNIGGCDSSFAAYANFFVLRHNIETEKSTLYLHLKQNSARASFGLDQVVYMGRPLAGADNTGHSCGDHLHFQIQLLPARGQCCAQSLDVWFDDVAGDGRVVHGQSYTSGNRKRFAAEWVGGSEWVTLSPGQTRTTTGAWKNVGWDLWRFSQPGYSARIGTWNPVPGQDQPSVLGGAIGCATATDWLACNRVRPTTEGVDPDQIGWFTFTLRGPSTSGVYRLHMRPVVEGVLWMEDYGVFWQVTVP